MQISSSHFRGSGAVLMATVLMGLIAAGTIPAAIAHEAKNRHEMEVDLVGQNHALTTRALGTSASHSVPDEAIDVAISKLFCLEARDAVQKGELSRQGQQWVLINGHRCRDERLLFDALGF